MRDGGRRPRLRQPALRLPLRNARRRSASSLSPRRPGHAKGEGGAFTHPQGPAARSRSRELGAPLFAHVPRSLAPPATSPRRSLLLRFVPADPVAHVAQESRRRVRSPQWTSRLPAKQRAVRFLLRAPASPSRSSSYISAPLAAAPLRPRRPTRPSNPREAQKLRSLAQQKCSLPEKQRLSHHPSLTTLRPLARRAPSQSRSPQLRFVPADRTRAH